MYSEESYLCQYDEVTLSCVYWEHRRKAGTIMSHNYSRAQIRAAQILVKMGRANADSERIAALPLPPLQPRPKPPRTGTAVTRPQTGEKTTGTSSTLPQEEEPMTAVELVNWYSEK